MTESKPFIMALSRAGKVQHFMLMGYMPRQASHGTRAVRAYYFQPLLTPVAEPAFTVDEQSRQGLGLESLVKVVRSLMKLGGMSLEIAVPVATRLKASLEGLQPDQTADVGAKILAELG